MGPVLRETDLDHHKQVIGERLRGQRGLRDQESFAERLDSPQQTVSKYERGQVPKSWLFLTKLHDEEGVDLNRLLTAKSNGKEAER